MPPEATANASPAGQQPKRRRVTLADRLRQASKMQFESPEQIAAREALEKMNRESASTTPGDTDSHGVSSVVTDDGTALRNKKSASAVVDTSSSGSTESAPKAPVAPAQEAFSEAAPAAASPVVSPDTGSHPVTEAVTNDPVTTSATANVTSDGSVTPLSPLSPVPLADTGDTESHPVTACDIDDSSSHPVTSHATRDPNKHPLPDAVTSDTSATPATADVASDAHSHPMTECVTEVGDSHPVTGHDTSDDMPSDASTGARQEVITQQTEARTLEAVVQQASSVPHVAPHTASEATHGTAPETSHRHAHTAAPAPNAEETPCSPCKTPNPETSAHLHDHAAVNAYVTETESVTETATVTPDTYGHPVTAANTVRRGESPLPAADTAGVAGAESLIAPHVTRDTTRDAAPEVSGNALPGGASGTDSSTDSSTVSSTVGGTQGDSVMTAAPNAAPETAAEASPETVPATAPGAYEAAGTETGAPPYVRSGVVTEPFDTTHAADAIGPTPALAPALAPSARHAVGSKDSASTVSAVTPLTAHDMTTGSVTKDNDSHPVTDDVTPRDVTPRDVTPRDVTTGDVTTTETGTSQPMAQGTTPVAERPTPVDGIHVGISHPAPYSADKPGTGVEQQLTSADHLVTSASHQVDSNGSSPMTGQVTSDGSRHGMPATVTPNVSATGPVSLITPGTLSGVTTSRTLLNSTLQVNIYNMVLEAGGAVFTSGGQMAKRFDVAVRSVRRTLDLMETKGILSRESGAAGMTLRLLMDPLSVMGIHASTMPVGTYGEDFAPSLGAGMATHHAGIGLHDESARFHPGMNHRPGAGHATGWDAGAVAGTDHRPHPGTATDRRAGQGTPEVSSGHPSYPVTGSAQSLPRDTYGHPASPQPPSNRQPFDPHMVSTDSTMHFAGVQGRAGQLHDMGTMPGYSIGPIPGQAQGPIPRQASGETAGMAPGSAPGMMSGPTADVMLFRERYPHLARAGFGPAQVKQVREALASRDLPDDLVEESLGYAEWELEHGTMVDAKGQPIAKPADWVFKSLAMHGCYRRPAGYVDPLEEARARIAERIAAQTAHREQLARLREEQEKLEMESVIDAEVERLAAAPDSAEVDELLQGLPTVLRAKGLESALVQREMRRRIRERLFPEG